MREQIILLIMGTVITLLIVGIVSSITQDRLNDVVIYTPNDILYVSADMGTYSITSESTALYWEGSAEGAFRVVERLAEPVDENKEYWYLCSIIMAEQLRK